MIRRTLILLEGNIQYSTGNGLLYVQAAQRLGLHPIALSADPAQYDYFAAGCEAISVDTSNHDALIHECSRLGESYDIAGITSVNESVYSTVGTLCRHFDLPGPNPASIEQCCDKFTQRQLLEKARVPIPAYRLVENATDAERAASEVGLPVVLKPAVGIGSSGVRLCRNLEEVVEHTTYLLGGKHRWRSSPRILIEEFAQGSHYYAKIMGNEVLAIGAASFGPAPHFVYSEVTFPAPLADHEHERIVDISLASLRALELGWGPTGIEFRWTKRGPVVIEVNPRAGGFPDPQLVQLAYGIDLVTEHLKLVIGEESNLGRTRSHAAAARILLPECDGMLDWIGGVSRAAAVPGVKEVKLYVKPKTPITRVGDYRDWLGHVIASSSNPTQTEAILRHAVDLIGWTITPFPNPAE
ncbi:MAG: ATP-grasp domain-containing protein [Mesorhizobium sp.]|uniref:ATP-grasp domain-containing protein n=1 Tax=Mesorhizobium sp. TaxID=1871066 RepID=UPI000FD28434|nr:acetyl-CoA carboxylase biotin carboxylase subunit family protein [Mesorhizobium sp.]RUY13387.1 ATP-grasp domain-containing protein [Mesorhizobium sp. M2A.F.Ca.ET.040.01.1.1]RWB68738.1 MAG: ATP-grasp domain-containing protein [Mesorhizobium sp.]